MKQVSFLLDKHRRDMWLDAEGDVWFYDQMSGYWQILEEGIAMGGFFPGNTGASWDSEPGSKYGPYTRIHKGVKR